MKQGVMVMVCCMAFGYVNAQLFYASSDKTTEHIFNNMKRRNFSEYNQNNAQRQPGYYSPAHLTDGLRTHISRLRISDKRYLPWFHSRKNLNKKSEKEKFAETKE